MVRLWKENIFIIPFYYFSFLLNEIKDNNELENK